MLKSDDIGELVQALSLAQAGLAAPKRNRTVKVKTKTGGEYEFDYTTLDAIIEHVRLALTANHLWFTQTLESADGKYRLITTLFHKSGQWLASETPIMPGESGNQAFGSALTYMKRYALAAMLGIASDDDDDGNAADGNSINARRDKPAANGNGQNGTQKTAAPTPKNGNTTAAEWATNATAKVKSFKTEKDLTAWVKANEGNIERLSAADSALHAALKQTIDDKTDSFRETVTA